MRNIPRGIVCYELAFQATKTRIERLSLCVNGNSGMRWGAEGDDWADGRIAGSDGVGPSSLEFWKADSGTLYDLVITLLELWGRVFELMLGVEDEFRASEIMPFDLCSSSFKACFRYFLQLLSKCNRSCNLNVGMTCQSNCSSRAWLTAALSWKSL